MARGAKASDIPRTEQESDLRPPACPVGFCPIGLALTTVNEVRPDVVEHLLAAGREMLLAMKAVIDARVEGFQESSQLEKIDIG